jgi:hypothetical protein
VQDSPLPRKFPRGAQNQEKSQIGQVGEVGDVESDRICRAALVSFVFAEILTSANSAMVKKGAATNRLPAKDRARNITSLLPMNAYV